MGTNKFRREDVGFVNKTALTFSEKSEVLDLYYVHRKSSREVEGATGIPRLTIQKILEQHGSGPRTKSAAAQTRSAKLRIANAKRDAEIYVAVRIEGYSVKQAAKKFAVSEPTVRTVLRNHNKPSPIMEIVQRVRWQTQGDV